VVAGLSMGTDRTVWPSLKSLLTSGLC